MNNFSPEVRLTALEAAFNANTVFDRVETLQDERDRLIEASNTVGAVEPGEIADVTNKIYDEQHSFKHLLDMASIVTKTEIDPSKSEDNNRAPLYTPFEWIPSEEGNLTAVLSEPGVANVYHLLHPGKRTMAPSACHAIIAYEENYQQFPSYCFATLPNPNPDSSQYMESTAYILGSKLDAVLEVMREKVDDLQGVGHKGIEDLAEVANYISAYQGYLFTPPIAELEDSSV